MRQGEVFEPDQLSIGEDDDIRVVDRQELHEKLHRKDETSGRKLKLWHDLSVASTAVSTMIYNSPNFVIPDDGVTVRTTRE